VADPAVRAVRLGRQVLPGLDRDRHLLRELRVVLHVVPAVHALPADRGHRRGQGSAALPEGLTEDRLMRPQGVLGVYDDLQVATSAIGRLREAGYRNLVVLSPAPHHELEHALEEAPSGVKWFTLTGAITGLSSAIALTSGTSWDWPLVTGGKPIVISPPYF